MKAICARDCDLLKELLNLLPSSDGLSRVVLNMRPSTTGLTLLHYAVLAATIPERHVSSRKNIERLLNHGADVQKSCVFMFPQLEGYKCRNFSPLWLAALLQCPSVASLLVDHGANPHQKGEFVFPGFKRVPYAATTAWQASGGHMETCVAVSSNPKYPPSFADLFWAVMFSTQSSVDSLMKYARWDVESIYRDDIMCMLIGRPSPTSSLSLKCHSAAEKLCKTVFCMRLLFAMCTQESSSTLHPHSKVHRGELAKLALKIVKCGAKSCAFHTTEAVHTTKTLNDLAKKEAMLKGYWPIVASSNELLSQSNLAVKSTDGEAGGCRFIIGSVLRNDGSRRVSPQPLDQATLLTLHNQVKMLCGHDAVIC